MLAVFVSAFAGCSLVTDVSQLQSRQTILDASFDTAIDRIADAQVDNVLDVRSDGLEDVSVDRVDGGSGVCVPFSGTVQLSESPSYSSDVGFDGQSLWLAYACELDENASIDVCLARRDCGGQPMGPPVRLDSAVLDVNEGLPFLASIDGRTAVAFNTPVLLTLGTLVCVFDNSGAQLRSCSELRVNGQPVQVTDIQPNRNGFTLAGLQSSGYFVARLDRDGVPGGTLNGAGDTTYISGSNRADLSPAFLRIAGDSSARFHPNATSSVALSSPISNLSLPSDRALFVAGTWVYEENGPGLDVIGSVSAAEQSRHVVVSGQDGSGLILPSSILTRPIVYNLVAPRGTLQRVSPEVMIEMGRHASAVRVGEEGYLVTWVSGSGDQARIFGRFVSP